MENISHELFNAYYNPVNNVLTLWDMYHVLYSLHWWETEASKWVSFTTVQEIVRISRTKDKHTFLLCYKFYQKALEKIVIQFAHVKEYPLLIKTDSA